ncbi:MAG: glycosyltransferase family 4 protein [Bacteroidales bacterium]|nr:glycosyltransferase family 4 protein [Bacteroidales bacterium]
MISKEKDKIDLVIPTRFLTQKITGAQRYGIEMIYALSEINDDLNIQFVSPKKVLYEQIVEDLNVIKYGQLKGHLWDQFSLLMYLNKFNNPLVLNLANTLPIFYMNKISIIHDIIYEKFSQHISPLYSKYYKFLFPLMIKNSRHIITVSNFSKKELIELYNLDEKNISVVYDCVSSKFKPLKANYPDKYILAVSSVVYYKNFSGLIEAFLKIHNDNKFKLYIVGGINKKVFGKKSTEILKKIESNENIKFLGFVDDEELIRLYSNAQCFIYPSFYEGFGLPPLEAQACGCPVIVSDIPVFREVYKDSVIFCDPYKPDDIASKIDMVLQSANLRQELIEKGFTNARNYDFYDSAKKLLSIVKKYL